MSPDTYVYVRARYMCCIFMPCMLRMLLKETRVYTESTMNMCMYVCMEKNVAHICARYLVKKHGVGSMMNECLYMYMNECLYMYMNECLYV